jgi:hypothetical protein
MLSFYKKSKIILVPVHLAYQPPAISTFLSQQTSHQQPASSTFLSEQTSTSHQPNEQAAGTRYPLVLNDTPTFALKRRN